MAKKPSKAPAPAQPERISYRHARELLTKPKTKKRKKYANKPVDCPTYGRFDSQAEYARYIELTHLQRARKITNLQRQVDFSIDINGVHICKYRADFVYLEIVAPGTNTHSPTFVERIEDKKGFLTKDCKLKLKLMEATGRPVLIT